jgi:hypothetical protein
MGIWEYREYGTYREKDVMTTASAFIQGKGLPAVT